LGDHIEPCLDEQPCDPLSQQDIVLTQYDAPVT
jgi:hypothetical protein